MYKIVNVNLEHQILMYILNLNLKPKMQNTQKAGKSKALCLSFQNGTQADDQAGMEGTRSSIQKGGSIEQTPSISEQAGHHRTNN